MPQIYNKLIPPDGRFYVQSFGESFIVVDFAHSPDALENICRGIREAFPDHRLKILFGCGGDRDRTKRPQMGKIAEAYAAEVYVTSDNPRSEDPAQIIDDIISGMSRARIRRNVERRDCVRQALEELQGKEVLLLAGKGHEDYILIKGIKHPYSDIREVELFLARKRT
jgi:UDP-N-acetylmuramoyl-L-alanyl-D-glutamate--2,6-diaminopimelate ligase